MDNNTPNEDKSENLVYLTMALVNVNNRSYDYVINRHLINLAVSYGPERLLKVLKDTYGLVELNEEEKAG